MQSSSAPNPSPDWLTEKSWEEIKRSTNLRPFARLAQDFDVARWKAFYDDVNPEVASLPQPWERELTDFQKLIVMRMIRPDKVIPKVIAFFLLLQMILFYIELVGKDDSAMMLSRNRGR